MEENCQVNKAGSDGAGSGQKATGGALTKEELAWAAFRKEEQISGQGVCLKEALLRKLRGSSLAPLMEAFNPGLPCGGSGEEAVGVKAELALAALASAEARSNDFTDDPAALIETALSAAPPGRLLSLDNLLGALKALRLAGEKIESMDDTLAKLQGLTILVLTMNSLSDFPGHLLPRSLRFLELHGNNIKDIDLLSEEIPERLYYVGLGRNCISDETSFSALCNLKYLFYLNLEDNDLVDLEKLLGFLQMIPTLRSLSLVGNPCSLLIDYRRIINNYLPHLIHLDGVELSLFPSNEKSYQPMRDMEEIAKLEIYCFRIMGFPQPKPIKIKNEPTQQRYQIEVQCPLLGQPISESNKQSSVSVASPSRGKLITSSRDRFSAMTMKRRKKSVSRNKVQKLPKDTTDRNFVKSELKLEEGSIDTEFAFKSDKVEWAKIISFPNPAVSIPVSFDNLTALRDTMRRSLIIQVYLIKSIKSRGISKLSRKCETIYERDLIANIEIPLKQLKWNDSFMGYIYNINKQNVIKPFKDLKELNILDKPQAEKRIILTEKDKAEKSEESGANLPPVELICCVAFGLKRSVSNTKKGKSTEA